MLPIFSYMVGLFARFARQLPGGDGQWTKKLLYKDTKPWISSFLVFSRVYWLEIQSVIQIREKSSKTFLLIPGFYFCNFCLTRDVMQSGLTDQPSGVRGHQSCEAVSFGPVFCTSDWLITLSFFLSLGRRATVKKICTLKNKNGFQINFSDIDIFGGYYRTT